MLSSQPLIIFGFQFKPNVRFNHPSSNNSPLNLDRPRLSVIPSIPNMQISNYMDHITTQSLAKKQVIRASSSSSTNHSWKYDVFLSFRGEDTRNNFTGHLHSSLVRKGIRTFIDDEGLGRGDEISPALQEAIQQSKIAILVLSENYASSTWCLQELVSILRCKESKKQLVYPVFYKVDPSDVRHQKGSFGQAFAEHESRFKDNNYKEQVIRWREALTKAADLSGKHFEDGRHESKFIDAIVEEISARLLDRIHLSVADYPVGIESRVKEMFELLRIGEEDGVHMVGIWGVGGIGKTTIARGVYNSIARQFDCSCFLEDVRMGSVARGGLADLQKNLLSKTLRGPDREEDWEFTSVAEGITVISQRLCHKKVLLVLDDVNHLEQLKNLAGKSDWFGAGSRIIITTRDKRLLTVHDIDVNQIYNMKGLSHHEALKLFKSNAFKENAQMDDYGELIDDMARYAQGLPLALVVWGRYLRGASADQWKVALKRYAGEPRKEIQDILRISYDALDDLTKEIYLHIACFFKGEDKNYVMDILEGCDLSPEYGIQVLKEKALMNVNEDNKISMHDLLEEMGKEIVRQESPTEPGERSRLWRYEDVYRVFMENTGTDKVRGIVVNGYRSPSHRVHLNSESFTKMKNLQIFVSRDDNWVFTGDHVNYLSNELRLLYWESCPFWSLPPSFNPRKLVVLRIRGRFETDKKLIPDLADLTEKWTLGLRSSLWKIQKQNLKYIDISYSCEFPNSVRLELTDWEAPLTEIEVCLVTSRSPVHFQLQCCDNLNKFEALDEVRSLKRLASVGLEWTSIDETSSSSVRRLINLENLSLSGCFSLRNIPCSILELQHLRHLDLRGCDSLVTLPTKYDDSRATGLHYDPLFITLAYCRNLVEVSEFRREIWGLDASGCGSLRRISRLSAIVEGRESRMIPWMNLHGCHTLTKNLADDYLAKMKRVNTLPEDTSEVAALLSLFLSCWQSGFQVLFPASGELPKWLSYRMHMGVISGHLYVNDRLESNFGELVIRFPASFSKGGLAFYARSETSAGPIFFGTKSPSVYINGVLITNVMKETDYRVWYLRGHVWLHYVTFDTITRRFIKAGIDLPGPSSICFVRIDFHVKFRRSIVRCGVHVVTPESDEDTLSHVQ